MESFLSFSSLTDPCHGPSVVGRLLLSFFVCVIIPKVLFRYVRPLGSHLGKRCLKAKGDRTSVDMNADMVKPKRTPAIIPQFFSLLATGGKGDWRGEKGDRCGVAETARQMLEARTLSRLILRASPFRSDSGRQRTSRHRAVRGGH